MPLALGNDINLGRLAGRDADLIFTRKDRGKHLAVCGTTGMGKSKFLENMIRQDIMAWHRSKCGLLLIDPHGNLYDNIIRWLAWRKFDRPIIPIDLRQDDWVVSYNLLRQRKDADPAVLVDNIIDAMAHVWGQGSIVNTPLFARWAANVLSPLYEKNLTLIDATYFIDQAERRIRNLLTADLKDKTSKRDWDFASMLTPKDFDLQLGSTINRMRAFIKTKMLRSIFGQPSISFNFEDALKEGQIVLVNLATKGSRISAENARLMGTLLFSDLWAAGNDRGKEDEENIKPFYVYVDEFQKFVTPTIAEELDQARGFGLHLTMAHQYPRQLLNEGEAGRKIYDSMMENASSKVVFRLTHEENLRPMAQWLFMGQMDADQVKREMYSTKVMQYKEELREIRGESKTSGQSHGTQTGGSSGSGRGGTENYGGEGDGDEVFSRSESESDFSAVSESESDSWSESQTHSKSFVPTIIPVLGKELAHVQYRTIDEQLFRAMATLFDQKERCGVARLVSMSAPVSIRTPDVHKTPGSTKRTKDFLETCYAKLPFALSGAQAQKQLADRSENLADNLIKDVAEPIGVPKRKIR